ncbi:unnamed protein product [Cuscuta campestris]|uniref:Coiled-coil domain-containing protein 86 n=2 Tax=Cuscuta sect. Cleistogrammica TaxID=1824901 RepID=A0A484NDR9_9ASTE|nr:hypothetical protein DM860_009159 [Cuscuta australis]VFQ83720.1 unnamed protein product [Cuscuta campestris]VFQ98666.1 unnamed protein product [Cuscuta campestris]
MACTIDFRFLDEGFGGKTYKRKRAEKESGVRSEEEVGEDGNSTAMEVENAVPPSKRQAVASSDDPNKPVYGKPTYDGVIAGRVSGRKWKQVRTHRSSALHVRKGIPLEQRVREKEIKKAYKERMNELKEEIRKNKVEKRQKREEREKKKKENILKSGTKFQKITNPSTLKKIAKSAKHKKLLRVVSDDVVNGSKKKKK